MSADPLLAFWAARLDEREAAAKAAAEASAAGWRAEPNMGEDWWAVMYTGPSTIRPYDEFDYPVAERVDRADAAHIARHDPARVLREVEAGRAILARHVAVQAWSYPPGDGDEAVQGELDTVIRHLIAAWSDHPDYRQEWKPRP